MKWLLIDTSCPRAVVAVSVDDRVVASVYLSDTKKHSEMLAPAVQEVLSAAQLTMKELDGVAAGKGPGSFIGSRIAIAFAKGVCVALNKPLVGVGTLASFGFEPGLPQGRGVAAIDARRGEYYVQTFEHTPAGVTAVDEPHLHAASEIEVLATSHDFMIGTSLSHIQQSQVIAVDGPSAEGMLNAFLATSTSADEKETLIPQYVRDPDAKPMDANKKVL